MQTLLIDSILIITLLTASVIDIKTHKIPNKVTFPAFLIILLAAFISDVPKGEIVMRLLIVAVLFFAGAFLRKLIGLGDIKLIMVLIMACGGSYALFSVTMAFIFFILFVIIKEAIESQAVIWHLNNIANFLRTGSLMFDDSKPYPFAPFLFLGYLIITGILLTRG